MGDTELKPLLQNFEMDLLKLSTGSWLFSNVVLDDCGVPKSNIKTFSFGWSGCLKKIPDVTNACRCQPQIFHGLVFVASSHFLLFVEVFQTCCWRPLISLSICLCKKFNPNAEAFDLLQIGSAWMGPLLPISINSLDQTVTILAVEFNDTRNETMVGQKLLPRLSYRT